MNTLSIDTTTAVANVSLDIDNTVINKRLDNTITHSEKLLPLIDECLKENKLKVSDINTFCVTTGPGSFTGLRIGIATIKGFAKISDTKIFATNSLEVIAYESIIRNLQSKYVLSLMDARNNRAYYALYRLENNVLFEVITPANDEISDAINVLNNYFNTLDENIQANISINIIGDSVNNYYEEISKNVNIKTEYIDTNISSETLLTMAKNYMSNENKNNNFDYTKYIYNYANLDATYIRPSQAERIKNGEQY